MSNRTAHDYFDIKPPFRLALLMCVFAVKILLVLTDKPDVTEAFLTSGMMAFICLLAALKTYTKVRVSGWSFIMPRQMILFTIPIVVGIYGLYLGLQRSNDLYYVYADIFHWFFELLLMVIITIWAIAPAKNTDILWSVAIGGCFLGLLGFLNFLMGMAGLAIGGGHFIQFLSVWKLEIGKGFPVLLLIPISAALALKQLQWPLRSILWIGFIFLIICLAVTFKRSMWLSFPVALFIIVTRKKYLSRIVITSMIVLPIAFFLSFAFDHGLRSLFDNVSRILTYSGHYTVQDTLNDRMLQLISLFPFMRSGFGGFGMGAQFYAFSPDINGYDDIHYIHNLYVYYYLQFGAIGTLIILSFGLWLLLQFWRYIDTNIELDWMLRTSFVGMLVMGAQGMVLLSTHTIFAGFIIGIGIAGLYKIKEKPVINGV